MKKYESPTIEMVVGEGVDPKSVFPILVIAVFLLAALYIAAGVIAIEAAAYVTTVSAYKTIVNPPPE